MATQTLRTYTAKEALEAVAKAYREIHETGGPRRVMLTRHYADAYFRIPSHSHLQPTKIFVRFDGWSLGACERFHADAEKTWLHDWVATIDPRGLKVEYYAANVDMAEIAIADGNPDSSACDEITIHSLAN